VSDGTLGRLDRLASIVLGTRAGVPAALPLALRVAAGCVFLGFSAGKFARHEEEAGAFDRYGLPWPDAFTYAIGVVELGGGSLLLLGLLTRPAAVMLAGNMIGAISTGGRVDGGPVHLGLAPTLLVTMLVLVWLGAGRYSVDAALLRRLRRGRPVSAAA
jgi:putative oxidoreductase